MWQKNTASRCGEPYSKALLSAWIGSYALARWLARYPLFPRRTFGPFVPRHVVPVEMPSKKIRFSYAIGKRRNRYLKLASVRSFAVNDNSPELVERDGQKFTRFAAFQFLPASRLAISGAKI